MAKSLVAIAAFVRAGNCMMMPLTSNGSGNVQRELLSELHRVEERLARIENLIGNSPQEGELDGSRVPTRENEAGQVHEMPLAERLRYLEHKVDGGLNWLKDPQAFRKQHPSAALNCGPNSKNFETEHTVCFAGWNESLARHKNERSEKCVVYDIGIREQPELGVAMMEEYGCSVRAYDPSPTSVNWWAGKTNDPVVEKLKKAGDAMYRFRPHGAGGSDDNVELYEYSWQQVSIYYAENDRTISDKPDHAPHAFNLPVKTLKTMMLENNDKYIDVLKIDIEGSEYLFLQEMFDHMGCPPVGQITVEWHHFSIDERYGASPEINVLDNLLHTCGYKAFQNRDHWRASPEWTQGSRQIPPKRYSLTSYCKHCDVSDA